VTTAPELLTTLCHDEQKVGLAQGMPASTALREVMDRASSCDEWKSYRSFGLDLECAQALPMCIRLGSNQKDPFRIHCGSLAHFTDAAGVHLVDELAAGGGFARHPVLHHKELGRHASALLYRDGTGFVVDFAAHQIYCSWPTTTSQARTVLYLFGHVCAFISRKLGRVCLHACAVELNGAAVLLLGQGGSGKSTLAGAFPDVACRS